MNIVVVHNHAFRLRSDGTIESADADIHNGQVILGDWLVRAPDTVDMTGGDMAEVRTSLERFGLLFQDSAKRLPSSEPLSMMTSDAAKIL